MTDPANHLEMSRLFDAPRALVYRAFTDPDQRAAWFGPVGFSVLRESIDQDLRVGGHQRFTMVSDTDPSMSRPIAATFTEVVQDELLVTAGTVGADGGDVMTLRLEFHDEGTGTRLELRHGPWTSEVATGVRAGWTSSFTRLDALLAA